MSMTNVEGEPKPKQVSVGKICSWICASVLVICVVSCVVLSAFQSLAITEIKVTALDRLAEPKDHGVPFIKQVDALPDYELLLELRRGGSLKLGAKPNASAADGLTWHLHEPVGLQAISTVRLQEQDKLISDVIAEVEYSDVPVIQNGYQFEFATKRSVSTGLEAFFDLPIGKAIAIGFTLAILILILSFFGLASF